MIAYKRRCVLCIAKSGYRFVPVHPEDLVLLGMKQQGKYDCANAIKAIAGAITV